jgi:hypothetical protein
MADEVFAAALLGALLEGSWSPGWGTNSNGKGWGKGKGKGKSQQNAVKQKEGQNWVTALAGCMGKKLKRPNSKDDLLYDCEEAVEDGQKTYQVTVASEQFSEMPTYTGKACRSQRDAKADAAMEALKAEFPKEFANLKKVIKSVPQLKAGEKTPTTLKGPPPAGQNKDPKSLLYNAVATVLGRPVTKNDFTWDITGSDQSHSATLHIPALDIQESGKPSTSPKLAEMSVCQLALKKVAPLAQAKQEEKKASEVAAGTRKRKLTDEDRAKYKAMQMKLKTFDDSTKVWVGGLAESVSEDELRTLFKAVGTVKLAEKLSPATAVIVFSNALEAASAAVLNGSALADSVIEVGKWEAREAKRAKKEI